MAEFSIFCFINIQNNRHLLWFLMPLNDGPKRSRDITEMVCFVGQIEIDGLISSFYISTGILYTGIISLKLDSSVKWLYLFRLILLLNLETCLCDSKIVYVKIVLKYYHFCLLFVLCIKGNRGLN